MLGTDNTKPYAIERWIERKLPGYRFGLVLLLLLVTFVFMASEITSSWGRVITVALQGLTLLAALRASQVHRRNFRIAALVALVAFVTAVASVTISTSQDAKGGIFVLNILIVAAAPIAIANALWHRAGRRHPHGSRRHLHLRSHGDDVRVPLRGHRLHRR